MELKKLVYVLIINFCVAMMAYANQSSHTLNTDCDSLIEQIKEFETSDSLNKYYEYLGDKIASIHIKDYTLLECIEFNFKLWAWREAISTQDFRMKRYFLTRLAYHYEVKIGDYPKAEKYYLQAIEANEKANLGNSYYWYLHNPLASIFARYGDYQNALIYYRKTEHSLDDYDSRRPRLYNNMAICYYYMGDTSRAFKTLNQVLKNPQSNTKAQCNAKLHLAEWHWYHDNYNSAFEDLSSLDTLLKNLKDEEPPSYYLSRKSKLSILRSLEALHSDDLNTSSILWNQSLKELKELYGNINRREFAKHYLLYANGLLRKKQYNKALNYADQALLSILPDFEAENIVPRAEMLYPENSIMEALELKAKIYKQQYDQTQSKEDLVKFEKCLSIALQISRILREDFLFNNSKHISLKDDRRLLETMVSQYYDLYKSSGDENFLEKIITAFKSSKAILLQNKRELNLTIKSLNEKKLVSYRRVLGKIDSLKKNIHNFKDEPEYSILLEELNSVKQQLLPPNDHKHKRELNSYIDFLVTQDRIFVLSKHKRKYSIHALPHIREIDRTIDQFNEAIRSKQKKNQVDSLAHLLYNSLLKPLGHLPKRLNIIPDSYLNKLAFSCLRNENGQYLIEKHSINYAPGNSMDIQNKITDRSAVVFNPSYDIPSTRIELAERNKLFQIEGAYNEAQAISKILDVDLVQGERATKSAFIESIYYKSLCHFAGHAVVDSLNQSYLAFNSNNSDSSKLYLDELDTLSLNMTFLNLNACNTHTGKIITGEGTLSLAREFFACGANSILSTLWNINDESAAKISVAFYENIKRGLAKDVALRKAQLKYLKQVDPDYKHPYYWSAYVLFGDSSELYSKWKNKTILLVAFTILIMISIALFRSSSKRPVT